MKNWKQALAVALCLLVTVITVPFIPSVHAGGSGLLQLDYLTRLSNLENAVFGALQVSTTAVINGGQVRTASGTLTNAQVKALNTTPVNVVPGVPGQAIVINGMVLMPISDITTGYGSGGNIEVIFSGGSTNAMGTTVLSAATLTGMSTGTELVENMYPNATVAATKDVGVDLTNASANFTAGNGAMWKYIVMYRQFTY